MGFGAEVIDALSKEIAAAKGADPLAPVTVIVTDHAAEVGLRRGVGSRPGGVANVAFVTWERFALDLVGPELEQSGRRRLSMLAFAAAVRVQLREPSGPLKNLASHASTERLVTDSITRLRSLPPELVATLAESSRPLTKAIAAMGPLVRERLGPVYDDVDVLSLAAQQLRASTDISHGDHTAPIIVALPGRLTAPERSLLASATVGSEVVLLIGAAGNPTSDDEQRGRVITWGADPGAAPTVAAVTPTAYLSAPDPEAEVRSVLRWCLEQHADGVAWSEIGVLYCSAEPYLRLLHQHLGLADITHSGPGLVTVGETLVGRVVGSVGRLVSSDLPRGAVMALLASAPIHAFMATSSGSAVPSSLWDRVSRNAGIVRGRASWIERLDDHSSNLSDRSNPTDEQRLELGWTRDLQSFMATFIEELDRAGTLVDWADLTHWLMALLAKLLPAASREIWSESERRAADQLELAISRLGELDNIDPAPRWDGFWQAVEGELARSTGRIGRLGDGVTIGPLEAARGAEFAVVAIVGCTEAALPRPVRGDAVFGPNDFDIMGWDAPIDSAATQHRTYLASLAVGSTHRLVSHPRSDPRRGRQIRPSRWADPNNAPSVPNVRVASAFASLGVADAVLDDAEERLARLSRSTSVVGAPLWQASDVLAPGAAAWRAKRQDPLSMWSGSVGRGAAMPTIERNLSITALEQFAKCPTSYFLGKVLNVGDAQPPDEVESLAPTDRGRLTHTILERFIQDRMSNGRPESPQDVWSEIDRARLHEIADTTMVELEVTGTPVGRELLWVLEQRAVHDRLDAFLDTDDRYRREFGARPEAVEHRFFERPLDVELPSGRRLSFVGSTDRVDRLDNGGISLIDYKVKNRSAGTSRAEIMSRIESGELLQLPLYARAAARELPEADASLITAAYWYLFADGSSRIVDVDLPSVDHAFLRSLDVIADLIEAGHFPVRPGDVSTRAGAPFSHCTYCAFDSICSTSRADEWERASATPELVSFVSMLAGVETTTET